MNSHLSRAGVLGTLVLLMLSISFIAHTANASALCLTAEPEPPLNFGHHEVFSTTRQDLTVKNFLCGEAVKIGTVSLSNGKEDFRIDTETIRKCPGATLLVAGECEIEVYFEPTEAKTYKDTVIVENTHGNLPVVLGGTGESKENLCPVT